MFENNLAKEKINWNYEIVKFPQNGGALEQAISVFEGYN
jgi:hypothetical protein